MNKEEIKRIVENLSIEANKVSEVLNKLEEDVQNIQKGDINGHYWSGGNANRCMKTALLQVEYDTSLLKDLEKKIVYLQKL